MKYYMEIKKEYQKDGKLHEITPFLNGKPHGLKQRFDPTDGHLYAILEYLDDTGENWDYYEFHPSGGLSFRMPIRNKQRNGICVCWNEDGVVIKKEEWKDDEIC